MVNEAKENEAKDKQVQARIAARTNLDHYIYEVKKQFKEKDVLKEKLTEEEIADFKKAISRVHKWFKDSSEVASKEEIEKHHKKFESTVNPFIVKAFGADAATQSGEPDEFDDLDEL